MTDNQQHRPLRVWGERCNKCGEAYTPFALKKRGGGFATVQCNCYAFGGEPDVPIVDIDDLEHLRTI